MIFMALFIMKRCHRDRNCGGSAAMKIHSFINTDILKEAKRYHGKPRSTLSSPWHFPGLRTVSRFRIHADLIDCGEISSLGTILSARISECDSAKLNRRKILWTRTQSVRLPFFFSIFSSAKGRKDGSVWVNVNWSWRWLHQFACPLHSQFGRWEKWFYAYFVANGIESNVACLPARVHKLKHAPMNYNYKI